MSSDDKKKIYEPPQLLDLGGGSVAASKKCRPGGSPSGGCQAGATVASSPCMPGGTAGGKCQTGQVAVGSQCKNGGAAAGQCKSGESPASR